ncbi:MAG TPA: hypothetical protein VLB67_03560 [Acidimicrobiia bacterium]|nr:hypothetical protein [Acidimicrobiia bacterium]
MELTLRLLHILGAVAWVGSALAFHVFERILARDGGSDMAVVVRHSQAIGSMIFAPASVVTVGSGIGLVLLRPGIGFTDLWVLIGIAGVLASGAVQGLVGARAEREVTASPTADAWQRLRRVGMADVAILVAVVVAMVLRPGV